MNIPDPLLKTPISNLSDTIMNPTYTTTQVHNHILKDIIGVNIVNDTIITTAQQKVICAWDGCITSTAKKVGLSTSTVRKYIRMPHIQKAIERRAEREYSAVIMSRQELQAFWTSFIKDESKPDGVRLDASDKLARSYGMYSDVHVDARQLNITSIDAAARQEYHRLAGLLMGLDDKSSNAQDALQSSQDALQSSSSLDADAKQQGDTEKENTHTRDTTFLPNNHPLPPRPAGAMK